MMGELLTTSPGAESCRYDLCFRSIVADQTILATLHNYTPSKSSLSETYSNKNTLSRHEFLLMYLVMQNQPIVHAGRQAVIPWRGYADA